MEGEGVNDQMNELQINGNYTEGGMYHSNHPQPLPRPPTQPMTPRTPRAPTTPRTPRPQTPGTPRASHRSRYGTNSKILFNRIFSDYANSDVLLDQPFHKKLRKNIV